MPNGCTSPPPPYTSFAMLHTQTEKQIQRHGGTEREHTRLRSRNRRIVFGTCYWRCFFSVCLLFCAGKGVSHRKRERRNHAENEGARRRRVTDHAFREKMDIPLLRGYNDWFFQSPGERISLIL